MNLELAEAIKASLGSYPLIRDKYYEDVFVSVFDYLDSDGSITPFKNSMKRAMVDAFLPSAETGWQDGGGELPISAELQEWLASMQSAEIGYIDLLFQTLKETRKGEDVQKAEVAQARATGYTRTLDMIYNRAKIIAAGSKMFTFVGDDGAESCSDCSRYKDKRHRASWWIQHDAIPPNRNFECHGYNCRHALVDDEGKVWTL